MSVPAAQLFFAILAIVVNVASLTLLVALVARRTKLGGSLVALTSQVALPMALLVTLTATLGSLWFSESVGFVPCKLCWYQRAAIFPMPLLLAPMVWRRDLRSALYLLPVLVVGSGVSIWHWLVERFPSLSGKTSCSVDVPCSIPWFTEFGFVTLAWMAFSTMTFTAVAIVVGFLGRRVD